MGSLVGLVKENMDLAFAKLDSDESIEDIVRGVKKLIKKTHRALVNYWDKTSGEFRDAWKDYTERLTWEIANRLELDYCLYAQELDRYFEIDR